MLLFFIQTYMHIYIYFVWIPCFIVLLLMLQVLYTEAKSTAKIESLQQTISSWSHVQWWRYLLQHSFTCKLLLMTLRHNLSLLSKLLVFPLLNSFVNMKKAIEYFYSSYALLNIQHTVSLLSNQVCSSYLWTCTI